MKVLFRIIVNEYCISFSMFTIRDSQEKMNIVLFEKKELIDNYLILTDYRAKHIVKVLRSSVGTSIRVGQINGETGTGTIVAIKTKYPFVVELQVALTDSPPAFPEIDLLLALPRPIMLKRILSQVTALGVGRMFLINANRVEKSFWDAGIVLESEYRPHLIHGLEQAVDTQLPEIEIHPHFRQFIEEYLPTILPEYGSQLIAHPHVNNSLSECLSGNRGRVLYAIGPEGGWLDFEVDTFRDAGFISFTMGTRILKVDTAVVSVHSRIAHVLEKTNFIDENLLNVM